MSETESASNDPRDLASEKVHWDLGTSRSYGEYLHLDLLLEPDSRA